MRDILIRDVPEAVVAAIDPKAQRLGLSRTEYLQRACRESAPKTVRRSRSKTWRASPRRSRISLKGGHGPSVAFTSWLIDKSALIRLAQSDNAAEWASRIERGLVRDQRRYRSRDRVLRTLWR
jgi:hypothetical protein